MAAAMFGLSQAQQDATKSSNDLQSAFSEIKNNQVFLPDNGISPKQYGLYIAPRKSNNVKRKMKSKLAFG